MTKRLVLTRHAKSSWAMDGPDHDRPLNDRGFRAAPAVGECLRKKGFVPDEILSSTAMRTFQTCQGLGFEVSPNYLHALYHASAPAMLNELKKATGDTVLMVGHNPGIGEFARRLVKDEPTHDRFLDYPTCATTVIEFGLSDWSDLEFGKGRVLDFILPRELG